MVTPPPAAPVQAPAVAHSSVAAATQQAAKTKARAQAKAKAKAAAKVKATARAKARAHAAAQARIAALASVRHAPREPVAATVAAPAPPVRTVLSSRAVHGDLSTVALALALIAATLLAVAAIGPPAARAVAGAHVGIVAALDDRRTEIAVAALSLLAGVTILAALSRWVI